MKLTTLTLIAALALSACVPLPHNLTQPENIQTMQELRDDQFCKSLSLSRKTLRVWTGPGVQDFYVKELKRRGYNYRDRELILDGESIGTNMTYRGMKCVRPGAVIVNRSFHPGIGHRWQVKTSYGAYLYLRGTGEESGMKIYSWN